jgi:hypothetical protein
VTGTKQVPALVSVYCSLCVLYRTTTIIYSYSTCGLRGGRYDTAKIENSFSRSYDSNPFFKNHSRLGMMHHGIILIDLLSLSSSIIYQADTHRQVRDYVQYHYIVRETSKKAREEEQNRAERTNKASTKASSDVVVM